MRLLLFQLENHAKQRTVTPLFPVQRMLIGDLGGDVWLYPIPILAAGD